MGSFFAKWRRSAAVAPSSESDSAGKKSAGMASRQGAFEEEEGDGVEEMETEITPEPNGRHSPVASGACLHTGLG